VLVGNAEDVQIAAVGIAADTSVPAEIMLVGRPTPSLGCLLIPARIGEIGLGFGLRA
jgi:hypothetical protein